MAYEKITRMIMEKLGEMLVVKKGELIDLIKNETGNPGNPKSIVESVTKSLVQQGLITPLYASESTFAITKEGMRSLNR